MLDVIVIVANYLNFYPGAIGGYQSPVIVLLSICIFELFRKQEVKCSEKIWKIDRLCFGVYLIHPIFIQFIYRFLHITPVSFDFYYLVVVGLFLFFVLCAFGGAFVLNRISPLRKYVL